MSKQEIEWIKTEKALPDDDEPVLWRYESGYMFVELIDKDWDSGFLRKFLKGYPETGRLTHWASIPSPKED
jgi:hypothetical protein